MNSVDLPKDALLALADRCEKATGPKRILDALIEWPEVFEPARISPDVAGQISVYWNDDRFCRSGRVPLYTRSLDAAMTLKDGVGVLIALSEIKGDGMPHCVIGNPETARLFSGVAATPALALCAAALRAIADSRRMAETPENGSVRSTTSGGGEANRPDASSYNRAV